MSTLSSVPEEKKLEEILAAVYNAGSENGLGKKITDPSEIMHRKEAFIKANPVCKEAIALINQQIKSVLDELEGEAEAFERTSKKRDGLTHFAVPLSTIQKIRSRYESSHSM